MTAAPRADLWKSVAVERRHARSDISERELGRVLVEEDPSQGTRRTFRVTPEPSSALVRIESARRLLAEELARLEADARTVAV